MNQKDLNVFTNFHKKSRMTILNQNLYFSPEKKLKGKLSEVFFTKNTSKFLGYLKKYIHCDLGNVAPVTLL